MRIIFSSFFWLTHAFGTGLTIAGILVPEKTLFQSGTLTILIQLIWDTI